MAEQTIRLPEPGGKGDGGAAVRLTSDRPTRGGDGVFDVLTNLPTESATASAVAEVYSGRWSVAGVFQRRMPVLKCKINTLGYPPAALFGFRVALTAGNVYAGVTAAVRAARGAGAVSGVSDDHLGLEVSGVGPGQWIAPPEAARAGTGGWSVGRMADWLGAGPGSEPGAVSQGYPRAEEPKPPRTRFADAKHIATSRLLKGEQT